MQNTITIVTGAASGIGREVARQAAERGSYVMATDVNEIGLAETLQFIKSAGGQAEAIRLDVSSAEAIQRFAEQTLPKLAGKKLILVNNAGVALASGNFNDTKLDEFEWLLSINLWGVIRMTKAFLPYMIDRNEGHIVNLSSVFGLAGVMNQSAYSTAKFGVRGFSDVLRMELLETPIKVTCVHPGGIKTNIAINARAGSGVTEEMIENGAKSFEKNAPTTPAEAARQILEGVRKNKARVIIGNDGKMIEWLTRLFPTAYVKMMKKQIEKTFDTNIG